MSKTLVRIANPNPATKKFLTSLVSAQSLIRRGHAKWKIPGKCITLLAIAEQIRRNQEEATDEEIRRRRSGVVFWNGSDHSPLAMRLPGEVVS